MKLIVGLGNPGDKYTATRHNAGFWFVEHFAAETRTALRKDGKFHALVGRHEASGTWLVLPQTFMNSSGRAVQTMTSFFKIQPADVLVVHDELDLPPGAARLKQGGGVAGHNGLKDISARLGSHDYWRLRLGIGRPAGRGATIDYVLHKPVQDERAAIDDAIARALAVLPLVLAGDTQGAMLKLHTQEPEPKPERPAKAPHATERADRPPARDRQPEAAAADRRGEAEGRGLAQPAPEPPAPGADPAGNGDEPARKRSTIERFGDAAQGRQLAPPGGGTVKPGAAGETANTAKRGNAEESVKIEKKGGLNSLLQRFLPGGGPARKK